MNSPYDDKGSQEAKSELNLPGLSTDGGHVTATSLQIAEHFARLMRAIHTLVTELPDEHARNFMLDARDVEVGQGAALRQEPVYRMTRDGFTLLAMSFTGREALRWKLAYISAFNAMEAKLRVSDIEPLMAHKEFRKTVPLRMKFKLQEQGYQVSRRLIAEPSIHVRRNLYWQLRQVNDTLGIPTEPMEVWLHTPQAELEGKVTPRQLVAPEHTEYDE